MSSAPVLPPTAAPDAAQSAPRWLAALLFLGGAALGFGLGEGIGWLEEGLHFSASLSTVLLLAGSAGLSFLLCRALRSRKAWLGWACGVLIGLALLGGYQAAQYAAFRAQLKAQISAQLNSQNIVPNFAAIDVQIEQIIRQAAGGLGGYFGFLVMKMTENGISGLGLFVMRILLIIAAGVITAREANK